jgi:hypothetical protein
MAINKLYNVGYGYIVYYLFPIIDLFIFISGVICYLIHLGKKLSGSYDKTNPPAAEPVETGVETGETGWYLRREQKNRAREGRVRPPRD